MRWIVISLLVINVGVFVYAQFFRVDTKKAEPMPAVVKSNSAAAPTSIRLLIEAKVSAADIQSIAAVPTTQTAKRPSLCTLVGPFSRLLLAEYFLEKLQALDVSSEIRSIVVISQSGFWLHLLPEKSRKDALRRLSELQTRGIDSYVIPDGNLANGISLGMFSDQFRAEAMKEAIQEQGYKPKIIDVPREQKELWVFLSEGESEKIGDEKWLNLISAEDLLQKRQNVCSDVASS
jgi:hypothetical protein